MSAKTERLEVRIDAETKERIEAAAARLDQSASAFVVHAAIGEANRVLARTETTMMSAEQFDALLTALDMADEAPPWPGWPSANAATTARDHMGVWTSG